MRTEVMAATTANIERAASALGRGEIVAFPTETVYGLGARADRSGGVAKIFVAKGRPPDRPLILHVSGVAQAQTVVAAWDARADALAERFWPGPVTIVLPAAAHVDAGVTAGGATVAVRAPGHRVALELIHACGAPIAAPSANLFGAPPPTSAAEVVASLGGRIPWVLDGGETPEKIPSTLVALTRDGARILRVGAVSVAAITEVLPLAQRELGS